VFLLGKTRVKEPDISTNIALIWIAGANSQSRATSSQRVGRTPTGVAPLLWQKIICCAINEGAEGVEVGVHRGLLVDGVLGTVDFGSSASNPFCAVILVESIICPCSAPLTLGGSAASAGFRRMRLYRALFPLAPVVLLCDSPRLREQFYVEYVDCRSRELLQREVAEGWVDMALQVHLIARVG
jgi:hypothetical protein